MRLLILRIVSNAQVEEPVNSGDTNKEDVGQGTRQSDNPPTFVGDETVGDKRSDCAFCGGECVYDDGDPLSFASRLRRQLYSRPKAPVTQNQPPEPIPGQHNLALPSPGLGQTQYSPYPYGPGNSVSSVDTKLPFWVPQVPTPWTLEEHNRRAEAGEMGVIAPNTTPIAPSGVTNGVTSGETILPPQEAPAPDWFEKLLASLDPGETQDRPWEPIPGLLAPLTRAQSLLGRSTKAYYEVYQMVTQALEDYRKLVENGPENVQGY
jgi:hypothetical protein